MRTWVTIAVSVALGLALGYGVGFVTSSAQAIFEMSAMTKAEPSYDAFTTVFRGVGRLAGAEVVAGFCRKPKNDPLASEDDAIRAIQNRAAAADLNPPLDVARARLAMRRAILAEKNNDLQLKSQYEETARQLLQKSGWEDPSPAHMRQIVTKLDTDGNTCGPSEAKGAQ